MPNAIKTLCEIAPTSDAGSRANEVMPISTRIPPSASNDANATARRDADNAASSGTAISHIAANDSMPPVLIAITMTRPTSASDDKR